MLANKSLVFFYEAETYFSGRSRIARVGRYFLSSKTGVGVYPRDLRKTTGSVIHEKLYRVVASMLDPPVVCEEIICDTKKSQLCIVLRVDYRVVGNVGRSHDQRIKTTGVEQAGDG